MEKKTFVATTIYIILSIIIILGELGTDYYVSIMTITCYMYLHMYVQYNTYMYMYIRSP